MKPLRLCVNKIVNWTQKFINCVFVVLNSRLNFEFVFDEYVLSYARPGSCMAVADSLINSHSSENGGNGT